MRKKWVDNLVSRLRGEEWPLMLEIKKEEDGKVIEGMLWTGNGRDDFGWSIEDGVPQFFPSAEDEFGSKWENWNEIKGWSTEYGRRSAILQFCSTLGVYNLDEARGLFFGGSNWLNAGCGIGWSESSIFNPNSESNRFAVDISKVATRVAYGVSKDLDNVFVLQGNILSLPFRKRFFDGIFSIGVLHHTPDPRLYFSILCALLKPGGLIGIYVYCKKPFIREIIDGQIREVSTKWGSKGCEIFSSEMAQLGKAFQRYRKPLEIPCDIPLLEIEKGTYDLQKFIYDHFLKCYYNPKVPFEYSVLNNFDWYHPKHASHHTREEIEGWFEENHITEGVKFIQPEGWEHSGYFVSGRKA